MSGLTAPAPAAAPDPSTTRPDPRIGVGATVAGVDPEALVEAHGSPLYVYDLGALRQRVDLLRGALPRRADLAFAVKANPSPGVLDAIARTGLGADVASGGELRAVLRAGFAPDRVVFTGPGKTDAEISGALRAGIMALTVESLDELDAVIARADEAQPGQGLMLRLAASGSGEPRPIIGGDGSAKFGLTDAEADAALDRLKASGCLAPGGPIVLRGFHRFGASNVLDPAVLVDGVRDLADRAERLAGRHSLAVECLDAGGGLGIPYRDDEEDLDIEALGVALAGELDDWSGRPALREARLLLEPGRWLSGPVGAFVCRVVRTKQRAGRTIAVVDGGIHQLLRPRLVDQDHRVVPVGEAARRGGVVASDVVGPLCTGLDVLASAVSLPAPRGGDLLAILDAGAYGFTESMPFFLSHPIPAEVVVDAGQVRVSRSRVEPD